MARHKGPKIEKPALVVSVTLEQLVGTHMLMGVDMVEEVPTDDPKVYRYSTSPAQVCLFMLGGVVYKAMEDENDGYRSALGTVTAGGTARIRNRFPPQLMLCSLETAVPAPPGSWTTKADVLVMTDWVTQKPVLVIGTDNTDDYYPSFVAQFHPENMAINIKAEQIHGRI